MVPDSRAKTAAHAVLAAVLQVRDWRLAGAAVAAGPRAVRRCTGRFPAAPSSADETLEESVRRHLAAKVDVREVSHLEQLETRSDPGRNPAHRELATAFLGLVPSDADPALPRRHALAPARRAAATRVRPRADPARRPRAPAREALVHEPRLRARAACLHDGGAARPVHGGARPPGLGDEPPARPPAPPAPGGHRASSAHYGSGGGRPAALYRFGSTTLEITDQFAVLRPPTIAR